MPFSFVVTQDNYVKAFCNLGSPIFFIQQYARRFYLLPRKMARIMCQYYSRIEILTSSSMKQRAIESVQQNQKMTFLNCFESGNVHPARTRLTHVKNTSRNWRAWTRRRTKTTISSGNRAVGVKDEFWANMQIEPWSEEVQERINRKLPARRNDL